MHYSRTREGLYDSFYEHDACGVGFVCNVQNEPSHDIVSKGIEMLINLEHRGACGCDEQTGDGTGILLQLPHAFFESVLEDLGAGRLEPGSYGAGLVFLPQDYAQRTACKEKVEAVIRDEGQQLLGWRRVPTNDARVGEAARQQEPDIWQVFVGRGRALVDQDAFERKLYVIRKVIEHDIAGSELTQKRTFYISSLSSRTIVYKGMLTVEQIGEYFPDLGDPLMQSALAMVHSRFSTNTLPQWSLAQPFRFLSHNGEINTLRGNVNWMNTRQALFESELFGDDMKKLLPILTEGQSDSAVLDNAVELLYHTGRSLPHAMMMLVPEAWEYATEMSEEKRAFYEYHSCLMEPWDGPATLPFTDGRYIGAVLDRNGLRPSRYTVTKDGYVILASETGVLDVDPANIQEKGRLQPGKMFLVDLEEKRLISDEEIKNRLATRRPYVEWIRENTVHIQDLPDYGRPAGYDREELHVREKLFGYTLEDERLLMKPMGMRGKEVLASMGDDTPLAVLSDKPRLLYDYFRQLFAQVTNPPLDAIREELVTSLFTQLGSERDLFQETPQHSRKLILKQPILTDRDLARIPNSGIDELRTERLEMLFDAGGGGSALRRALERICMEAERAVEDGRSVLVLSDRSACRDRNAIPALLATAAVHHHLIRKGLRTRASIVVESGEPREVHHFCTLIGYGADAVNPYLALQVIVRLLENEDMPADEAKAKYIKAVGKGILKVMSKMGISTVQSYRGAQIFEAVGIAQDVIDAYFAGTASRIGGIGLDVLAEEARMRHQKAYPNVEPAFSDGLEPGGKYLWRRNGEHHLFNPMAIARLQHAVRSGESNTYARFAQRVNDQSRQLGTLRGLLDFDERAAEPVPIDEVEPWTDIVKRFKTGAMSYGSISSETHEALAVAMNRIDGKSNTGEGGEDPGRYDRRSEKRSRIKQVASGRFGVTIDYLTSADEIQIKMAQGAKPGEGGQLPGEKVYPWIAKTRHSTPYVGLISPPPHHDIYSIEDLAQLIHDLKNANPNARVTVKLVSEVGVGTIAAGVAKGKADVVLISGHDGGTGASPATSIMHAGLPWELGLAETHQVLVRNGLRSRIKVECDGQIKTGRDVAFACLLGADEFGFATAPLVAMGCIMMRKCHLNTCPVGIATQDPELRKKFEGKPEHVINYFHFVAEELREIMARLGFRTVEEMVGHVDRLKIRSGIMHWKAKHLNLSPLLVKPEVPEALRKFRASEQDHGIERALDHFLIKKSEAALTRAQPVELDVDISNTNRTIGTLLSAEVSKRYPGKGLPDDTIRLHLSGSGGQSFFAFGARGITVDLHGDANDYFAKGLSGARLIVRPPESAAFEPHENIIIGNVALYGATSGEVYVRGQAGERFAVRNSGVRAVVEGIGDHGCEYMTGGRVVVLGPTGRNFAAGMSGGVAYVLDGTLEFRTLRCNSEMVDLEDVEDPADVAELRQMVENHYRFTDSSTAAWVLRNWESSLEEFVKVMPIEYRNALLRLEEESAGESISDQVAA
jgi:glutamate synthase domain-containing protein 2/glutamate synthase domain-containing protein 1/glutamate synthase domain-containing protein 3